MFLSIDDVPVSKSKFKNRRIEQNVVRSYTTREEYKKKLVYTVWVSFEDMVTEKTLEEK